MEFTLGRDPYDIHGIDVAEPLEEGIAGELTGESAEIFGQESTQQIAAESTAGTLRIGVKLFGRRLAGGSQSPTIEGELDELGFEAALAQERITIKFPRLRGKRLILSPLRDGG